MKQHTIKIGQQTLPNRLTEKQARLYGERRMPKELRRAGFEVVLFHACEDINGWDGIRINYGKR